MFLYLFARFILNPKLLLTDLRSEYGGYLSLIAAILAVSTLTMSNHMVFGSSGGVVNWILQSVLCFVLLYLAALLCIPIIHLFAEKSLPGSRISDLMVYSGFILAPLVLTLPAAFILLLLGRLAKTFYVLFLTAITIKILLDFFAGIRDNYQITRSRALVVLFAPLCFFIALPALAACLFFLMARYG